ncbi:hypothetical protein [Paraburkholderia caledonica]|uniref:Uncharacterized protein n=1 Tax=Paraburkholderia caledonica TaxID=134536 RepID=A0AB73I7X6_9BURK|nr:hypothetical protein [Paraburkholderia caledonica]
MSTTSKLGADMTDEQILDMAKAHFVDATRISTVLSFARALLARQPAAIDKQEAVAWPVPLSIETNYEIGQTVELIFESDEDAETFSRLYSEQMGDKLPQEDCNLYTTPLANEASKPAPSVEQDERGAISEHDAKGLEIIASWMDRDGLIEPAEFLRGIAARAASTSANVAQGAEAVGYIDPHDLDLLWEYGAVSAELHATPGKRNTRALYFVAPLAQTALTEHDLRNIEGCLTGSGYVGTMAKVRAALTAAQSASGEIHANKT